MLPCFILEILPDYCSLCCRDYLDEKVHKMFFVEKLGAMSSQGLVDFVHPRYIRYDDSYGRSKAGE